MFMSTESGCVALLLRHGFVPSSAQSQRGAAGLSGLVRVDKNSAVIKLLNAWKKITCQ